MARILYTINGEGLGHATRSRYLIEQLQQRHTISLAAGFRAYHYYKKLGLPVFRIYCSRILYRGPSVRVLDTLVRNVFTFLLYGWISLISLWIYALRFKPDIIISDYEQLGLLVAKMMSIPSINVDNQSTITRCTYALPRQYALRRNIVALANYNMTWPATYFCATSFIPFPLKPEYKHNTFVVPILLRKEILGKKPLPGKHILVYQTSHTFDMIAPLLKCIPERFIVYPSPRESIDGNLHFKRFSETAFVKDLRASKAVITNGGFSLISEALYLHKPVYSVPVRRQYEQIFNAIQVQRAGYGEHHDTLTVASLKSFLRNAPKYERNLRRFTKAGNEELLKIIDALIKKSVR